MHSSTYNSLSSRGFYIHTYPPPSASLRLPSLSSLFRTHDQGPSKSHKNPVRPRTRRYQLHHRVRIENSDYLSRDSQQAPPAYDVHVVPPSDGSPKNSLSHDPPVESPLLLVSDDLSRDSHVAPPQLLALKGYDTQFLIDDSGSMRLSTSTVATGKTHWQEVNDVLSNIVEICAELDNGVDVFFFNSSLAGQFNGTNIKNPDEIMNLFKARYQAGIRGSTSIAEALDLIIAPYLQECERHAEDRQFPMPKHIIVMTDGAANSIKLLKQNLISYARRLDMINAPPYQIGVRFFQVGNAEGVGEFLIYLDNAMSEENDCRNFIDTRSSEEMGLEGLTARRVLTRNS